MKNYLDISVYDAAQERIEYTFNEFEKIYLSFSGGKDSTVMLHMVMKEAIKRGRKIGVMIVDLEAQYSLTMDHVDTCIEMYKDHIDLYWVCLPMSLRNAVSVYEPQWVCWDEDRKDDWVRDLPKRAISDVEYFPFFTKGMEFEEFVPLFGEWYAGDDNCACFVGIRADESLNRYRTIASKNKKKWKNKNFTTLVECTLYNVYPIYDWKTEDIWTYVSKFKEPMNQVYQRMHMAKVPLQHQRICQPYGDDQKRGLWLFHLLEPQTWNKVVQRVSGANSGSLYINEGGKINGSGKISKPENHTYKSYCELLLVSLPKATRDRYSEKFNGFIRWWIQRGYPDGLPDEAPYELEAAKVAPSYRRIAKCILRNDYWCKGLSFTQPKSEAYKRFIELKKQKTN